MLTRMRSDHRPWLLREIAAWETEHVISPEQAAALRARYPAPPPAASSAPLVIGGIGALIVGLGIILLLAWNWQDLGRHGKLAIVLLGTAALHAAGIAYGARGRAAAAEILHLLGSMGFGAGIWLIGQAYHLSAHWPDGFLAWAAGTLALALALRSAWQAILAAGVLILWSWSEWIGFSAVAATAPALALVVLGGLADRLRASHPRRAQAAAAATAVALIGTLIAVAGAGHLLAVQLLALATLCGALGEAGLAWSGLLRVLGLIVLLPTLALFGFSSFGEWTFGEPPRSGAAIAYASLTLLAALLAAARTARQAVRGAAAWSRVIARALVPAACLLVAVVALMIGWSDDEAAGALLALPCSLALIAVLLLGLVATVDRGRAGAALGWALPLAGWLFVRFCFWFDSLAARGTAFVLLGLGLILIGGITARRARALANRGTP